MANQITVQVYAIDNIPQRTALNVSFPTNQISAQLATSVLATNIQSQINYYPNPNNQAQLTEVLVSQSISDIATLASTSMFAASIYKINGYPQGGQALSMLFPSVQPSIWNVSGGGDVHSFVQFKGKKYYAHETSAALATAANAGGGGGGGGLELESYQNSAMSAAVMAYVYRDADDNIFGIYEPIRNNKVYRQSFAYADSIDLFPFDSVDCFNTEIEDVKLLNLNSDVKFRNTVLSGMIINGNNHAGLDFLNWQQNGCYGVNCPNSAEIYISGTGVRFYNSTCGAGGVASDNALPTWFDSVGQDSYIHDCTFSFGVQNYFYGRKGTYNNSRFDSGAVINLAKDNLTIGDSCHVKSEALLVLTGNLFDVIVGESGYIFGDIFNGVHSSIVSVNQGAKTFKISGDHVADNLGMLYINSGGNFGYYNVVSVTLNSGDTDVVVTESIPTTDTTGQGYFIGTFGDLTSVNIGVSAGAVSYKQDAVFTGELNANTRLSIKADYSNINLTKYSVKSGAVTVDDIPQGATAVFDDGTDVRVYVNKGGTIFKSAALT